MFRDRLKFNIILTLTLTFCFNSIAELNLDGVSEKVIIEHSNAYNKPQNAGLTVECFIKTTDSNGIVASRINKTGHGYLLGVKNGKFMARLIHEGGDRLLVADNYGPVINDDKWHHIAFTINGSGVGASNFYVDAETIIPEVVFPFLKKPWSTTEPIIIGWADAYGHCNGANVGFYSGAIKHFRVWNKYLSIANIRQNMNTNNISGGSSNRSLIADFRFKQTDRQLNDFSHVQSKAKLESSKKTQSVAKSTIKKTSIPKVENIKGSLRGCHERTVVTTDNLRKVKMITATGDHEYLKPSAGKIFITVTAALKKGFSASSSDYKLVSKGASAKCVGFKKYKSETFSKGLAEVVNKSSDKLGVVFLFEVSPSQNKLELVSNLKTTLDLKPLSFDLVSE